jgi:NitT/TauT family transport system substrate-binding protein
MVPMRRGRSACRLHRQRKAGSTLDTPRITRRRFSGAAVSAAALGAPALWAQSKPEKSRISLALVSKASFAQLPVLVAQQLGYFHAEGLELEMFEYANEAAVVPALASGAADAASAGFANVFASHGQRPGLLSFVSHGRAPQIAVGTATRNNLKSGAPADSKGSRVGVPELGGTGHMIAGMVLKRSRADAQDAGFVAVGSSAGALGALRSGQIETICAADPVMTQLEQKNEVRLLADTRNLKGVTEVFGGPVPSGCLFATPAFVNKHPNTTQAMANAIVRALKWLRTAGPSDLVRTVPEAYLLGDRALYLACYEKTRESYSVDGLVPMESARLLLRAVAAFDAGVRSAQVVLSGTFSNDFARRAFERYKL